jgi:tetratricopeptide (TPR) repeat protein
MTIMKSALRLMWIGGALFMMGCAAQRKPVVTTAPTKQAIAQRAVDAKAYLSLSEIGPRLPAPATQATTTESDPPMQAVVLYAQARAAILQNQRQQAIHLLQQALDLDPNSLELRIAMGRANLGAGGSPDRALEAFERALKLKPDNLDVQNVVGRLYLMKGDLTNGLAHLRLASQTSGYSTDPEIAVVVDYRLARSLQQAGYDRAALEVYEKLLKRFERPGFSLRGNPDLAYLVNRPELLYVDIGSLYEKHQDYAHALEAYEIVAQRSPDNFEAQSRVVRTLLNLNRRKDAATRALAAVRTFKASDESIDLLREVYRRNGNEPGVVPALRQIFQERPKDHAILFALANTLDALGKADDAETLLSNAFEKANGQNFDIAHRLVAMYLKHDEAPRAAALLVQLSARQPDLVSQIGDLWDDILHATGPHHFRLADLQKLQVASDLEPPKLYWVSRVALMNGRLNLSNTVLEKSAELKPLFPPTYRALLNGYWMRGSWDVAKKVAASNELIASIEAQAPGLAAELRGTNALNQDKPIDAEKAYAQAITSGDNSADVQFFYALSFQKQGDLNKFERLLWKVISDHPSYDLAYTTLFGHYLEHNSAKQAMNVLSTWVANDPASVNARLFQATVLSQGGKSDAAERILLDLFDENPDSQSVVERMEAFYLAANRLPTLVEHLEDQRAAHPENRVVVQALVDVYSEQNKTTEAARAIDDFRSAVGTDPDQLYAAAGLYTRVDQKLKSEDVLEQVLRVDPQHVSASNDLGYFWADQGKNLAKAEALIRAAVEAEPDNESFLDSLAWVLYKRGEFLQSRKFLQQAIASSESPDPVMLDHLGDVMYQLNDTTQAQELWKRSLTGITTANVERSDLAPLRLKLEAKLKQASSGGKVNVAPTAQKQINTQQANGL